MAINTAISDLFLAIDLGPPDDDDAGEFGYHHEALREHAGDMLFNLAELGVLDLPTIDEVVADFLARL